MQPELLAVPDRLARQSIPVVLASHELGFAYRWADDIPLLAAGRCLAPFAAANCRRRPKSCARPGKRCWHNFPWSKLDEI